MNKSELIETFTRIGFQPNPKRGQNFLIDPNMCRAIVEAAELDHDDIVLEIGPGTGALTELLCDEARSVVAVEIDRDLFDIAMKRLGMLPNLRLILGDAVTKHRHLNSDVAAALRDLLKRTSSAHLKVVSNLPYSVSSPAVVALLTGDLPVYVMVVTVQKEIADRVAASPGTKDYSLLSVTVQAVAEVKTLRRLPPDVFWPRPKVSSSTIEIRPRSDLQARIADKTMFSEIAHALFAHRRKTVLNCLRSAEGGPSGLDAAELLSACRIDPRERGEALSVETIIELANKAVEWESQ